jgi:hypothetical protein
MIFEKLIHHLPQQPLIIHFLYPSSTSESEYLFIFSIVLIFYFLIIFSTANFIFSKIKDKTAVIASYSVAFCPVLIS